MWFSFDWCTVFPKDFSQYLQKTSEMKLSKMLATLAVTTLSATGVAHADTYSPDAISTLRYMIEEEKLAGDVYRSFGALYPTIKPFINIPKSEDTHLAKLVGEAALAGVSVTDLTTLPANTFQNQALQSLFASLVAKGSTSSFAALTVGRDIELMDIVDLDAAMLGVPMTSTLYTTYGQLRAGSVNHLNAFNYWLTFTPAPAVPEPETYALMLAGLGLVSVTVKRRKSRSGGSR